MLSNFVVNPRIYRLGSVRVRYSNGNFITANKVRLNEITKYENSPLAAPTKKNPLYTEFSSHTNTVASMIKVYPFPENLDAVHIDYVRRPFPPNWTYIISSTGNALFNPNNLTQNFELHSSEETNLVIKILQLAGIAIKDFNLLQAAGREETKSIQLEKQ